MTYTEPFNATSEDVVSSCVKPVIAARDVLERDGFERWLTQ